MFGVGQKKTRFWVGKFRAKLLFAVGGGGVGDVDVVAVVFTWTHR